MPIPDYQSAMLPLLRSLEDGQEYSAQQYRERVAEKLNVTAEERNQKLASGKQSVFDNRVGWACTYLVKAKLIERPRRARVRITERGREALRQNAVRIDNAYLSRFPEFVEFVRHTSTGQKPHSSEAISSPQTQTEVTSTQEELAHEPTVAPEEQLEASYFRLRKALAEELLEQISESSPRFFEQLVVDLLVSLGYGGSHRDVVQAVGFAGDDGIDGIIKEDRLGLDFVSIQAKRWKNVVGRPEVQAFAGSLEGRRARKGVFITTSSFSKEAHEYVTRIEKRIVLMDGEMLTDLMIDQGIGVTEVATYQIKRIDSDYFGEE